MCLKPVLMGSKKGVCTWSATNGEVNVRQSFQRHTFHRIPRLGVAYSRCFSHNHDRLCANSPLGCVYRKLQSSTEIRHYCIISENVNRENFSYRTPFPTFNRFVFASLPLLDFSSLLLIEGGFDYFAFCGQFVIFFSFLIQQIERWVIHRWIKVDFRR